MPNNHQCANCGASLSCSANQQCWCMEMPAVLPLNANRPAEECYCRRCLSQQIAAQLEQEIASRLCEVLAKAAMYSPPSAAKPSLQEYIDYYPESQEFTAWYHLKRGYCCESGCKYCPYPSAED